MLDTKLYTLLKVAEYRNYTQAAKSLNLTQPAVSQHIHALENELGVRLFERLGNRLVLTRAGEKAVSAARAISTLYDNLKYEISDSNYGVKELNIGITHTVESNRISEALAKYVSENRNIKIKLITDTQSKLRSMLKNYELDMAIIDGSVSDKALVSKLLDTDRIVLVIDPSHPLAQKDSVTIDEIRHEKMILRLPGSGTGNMFLSAIQYKDINIDEFDIILEVDNIATIKDLVRQRYGVSVLAESACMDEIMKKKLVALPIEQLNMKREINIIYTKGFQYEAFADEIVRTYRELL
ncbi:MAG: LysR family transcriptional regulator [Solobacterium sp.]|nr:LysR family transcriptional regulator [Solobacterium sp.]